MPSRVCRERPPCRSVGRVGVAMSIGASGTPQRAFPTETKPRRISQVSQCAASAKSAPSGGTIRRLMTSILTTRRRLSPDDLLGLSRDGFRRGDLRHARRVLSRRSAGVHSRLAAGDGRQPGGHLRPDRADRAAAARRALVNELGLNLQSRALLGHGRVGRSTAVKPLIDLAQSFARRPTGAVLQSHSPRAANAEANLHFPRSTFEHTPKLRPGALRSHAGRAGRSEALGLQRPAATRRRSIADEPPPPRLSIASSNARRRSAPDDDHPERAHLRRRRT